MKWNTQSEICGQRVAIRFEDGDELTGRIVGESVTGSLVRVLADDGEVYVGNQWDSLE